ncbi:hypothetical protein ACTFIY_000656 [Dictyostelium cf. discoideum]
MASFLLYSDNTENIYKSNNIKMGEENNNNNNISNLILNEFDIIKLNIESDFKNNNNNNKKNNNKFSIINNIYKNKKNYSYHQICYESTFNKNKLIYNKKEAIFNNQLNYCDNVHFHKKYSVYKNENGVCIWSWEFDENVKITRCLIQLSFSLDSTEKGIDIYIGNKFFNGKEKKVIEYVKRNFYKVPIDEILDGNIFNFEMDLSEYTIGFSKLSLVCILTGGNFNEFSSNNSNQGNITFNCTFQLCENLQIKNSNNSDNSNSNNDNDNNNQNNSSNKESFCFIKNDFSVKSIETSNTSSSIWVTNKQSLVINKNFGLIDSNLLTPQHFQQLNFDNTLSINVNNKNNNKLSMNDEKSDFQLIINKINLNVHKEVLSKNSDFFKNIFSVNSAQWELVGDIYLNYQSLEDVLKLVYFTSYESLSYENFKSIKPEQITRTIYICQHLSFCKLLKLLQRFIFENVD